MAHHGVRAPKSRARRGSIWIEGQGKAAALSLPDLPRSSVTVPARVPGYQLATVHGDVVPQPLQALHQVVGDADEGPAHGTGHAAGGGLRRRGDRPSHPLAGRPGWRHVVIALFGLVLTALGVGAIGPGHAQVILRACQELQPDPPAPPARDAADSAWEDYRVAARAPGDTKTFAQRLSSVKTEPSFVAVTSKPSSDATI